MPEGPSIIILKESIEALHLKHQEVLEVTGSADTIDQQRLVHQKIRDFKSWGKHFLICFKDFTLRIHLMLFGSYLINESKKTKLKLGLIFKSDEINFYTCKVDILEGDIKSYYDWRVDIMSDDWDEHVVLQKILEKKQAFICDVLLDQHTFAGVGNIIKNEALYRAAIHPLSMVSKIPKARLKKLLQETRKYSFDFLTWKKENVLSKHWEVYHQKRCPEGHPVQKEEVGRTHRQTYYCKSCQTRYE